MICIFVLFTVYIGIRLLSFQTEQSYQNALELTQKISNEINSGIEEKFGFLKSLKITMESNQFSNREQVIGFLKHTAMNNKDFQGLYIMYKANAFDGNDEKYKNRMDLGSTLNGHFDPWWYWSDNQLTFGMTESDYFDEEYFSKTINENKNQLIEPYVDSDLKILVSSLTYPIERNGKAIGIVGGDITLDYLDKMISEYKFLKSGYVFLLSKNGTFISFKDKNTIGKTNFEEYIQDKKNNDLIKLNEMMKKEKNGIVEAKDPITNKKSVYIFNHFSRGNWILVTVANKSEILQNVYELVIGMILLSLLSLIIFIYVAGIIAKKISQPVNEMTRVLKDISEGQGDLTVEIKINSSDEVGDMAFYFNKFVSNLRNMMIEFISKNKSISNNSNQLYDEAKKLLTQSEAVKDDSLKLSDNSETVLSEILTIKSAIEQATNNIGSLADETNYLNNEVKSVSESSINTDKNVKEASNELTKIVSSIETITENANNLSNEMKNSAAAVNEMSTSISEVSNNAKEADTISQNAKEFTSKAQTAMSELESSAKEIKKIVNMIEQITDQTNMLALNATIEAASAGEAGKGFAVVANEVKVLAGSTAQATKQIAERIEVIQSNVDNVVNMFNLTIEVIDKLYHINHSIAVTVEQQSLAANEIAGSVEKSSNSADTINLLINNINDLSQIILRSILKASDNVTNIASNTNQISSISGDISRNSQEAHLGVNEISKSASEINNSILEMAHKISKISDNTNESANQAHYLNDIATNLITTVDLINALISKFKVE
jgi:methyl-accepting chemotaxis protein